MDKILITAAITGAINVPTQSPYLPITPQQIIDEAVKAYEAGASVAHIHVRNPQDGSPTADLGLFRQVAEGIKKRCNLVLCITTGGGLGAPPEERIKAVPELRPELASFNMGSINFALYPLLAKKKEFKYDWEPQYLAMTEDFIFANTFKTLKHFCSTMAKYDTKPELEIYDAAHINNAAHLLELGYLKKPVYLQFVLGVLGAIPASVQNLVFLLETARGLIGEFEWSVCAAGRHQLPMAAAALALGGNVRVGLEDSVYIRKGVLATSNAEQVAVVRRFAEDLSLEIATPDEARRILGLKGLDKVNF